MKPSTVLSFHFGCGGGSSGLGSSWTWFLLLLADICEPVTGAPQERGKTKTDQTFSTS